MQSQINRISAILVAQDGYRCLTTRPVLQLNSGSLGGRDVRAEGQQNIPRNPLLDCYLSAGIDLVIPCHRVDCKLGDAGQLLMTIH